MSLDDALEYINDDEMVEVRHGGGMAACDISQDA
jgi:hypothetical protein